MKCLKGPVPRVVATASGEAAADQEMAHLLLAQGLSGISRSEELLGSKVFFFLSLSRLSPVRGIGQPGLAYGVNGVNAGEQERPDCGKIAAAYSCYRPLILMGDGTTLWS